MEGDINLIIKQTHCHFLHSYLMLYKNDGDIVNAILDLTMLDINEHDLLCNWIDILEYGQI